MLVTLVLGPSGRSVLWHMRARLYLPVNADTARPCENCLALSVFVNTSGITYLGGNSSSGKTTKHFYGFTSSRTLTACILDMASGYQQVPVAEQDRPKTAFSTRIGLYQWWVMLVLGGLTFDRCLIYLDDVIAFGRDFDDAIANLSKAKEMYTIS